MSADVGAKDRSSSPVVDWSQYVMNRVDSRSASPAAPGSPLRGGTPAVYTVAGVVVNNSDNIDVLARAKQHQREVRRVRERASEYSTSSLAHENPERSPFPQRMVNYYSLEGQVDIAASSNSDLGTEHIDIAELVKALHAKVYERTIKEAQYDMLVLGEREA